LEIAPTGPVIHFKNREPLLKWCFKGKRASHALRPPLPFQCVHPPSEPQFGIRLVKTRLGTENPPRDRSSSLSWTAPKFLTMSTEPQPFPEKFLKMGGGNEVPNSIFKTQHPADRRTQFLMSEAPLYTHPEFKQTSTQSSRMRTKFGTCVSSILDHEVN
jgi:hypothetical protein